jgi:carbon storage regulator CsrA
VTVFSDLPLAPLETTLSRSSGIAFHEVNSRWEGEVRMLVLTKQVGEDIVIGDTIHVTVIAINSDNVRLGITAPKGISVDRQDRLESRKRHSRKREDNKMGFMKTLFGGTSVDYLDEGKAYLDRGLYYDAIEAFEESIRLNPQIAAAYLYRGNAYFAEDDFGKAITDYGNALMIDPKLALAYHQRGRAYLEMSDVAKCTVDQQRAIQLDPNGGNT